MDTRVSIKDDRLVTELYQKETDNNKLLHFTSGHPRSMIRGLPYSQFLRAKRITHDDTKWKDNSSKMSKSFQERGYPPRLISEHANKIDNLAQEEVFKPRDHGSKPKRFPFVSTYTDLSPKISSIVRKHWHVLNKSYVHIPDFQTPPVMSYRRNISLKDRLVQTDVKPTHKSKQLFLGKQKLGSFPCLNCVNCRLMVKGDTFCHPTTGTVVK